VIHLVLDTNRQKAFRLQRERLAFLIERAHRHFFSTAHLVINARNRQTTFLALLLAAAGEDFRVDEHFQLVALLGNIHHDDLLMHIHLRRRQAHAGRGIHGFRHVAHQFARAFAYLFNPLGCLAQTLIGIYQNF
jgi:hypothetical protein